MKEKKKQFFVNELKRKIEKKERNKERERKKYVMTLDLAHQYNAQNNKLKLAYLENNRPQMFIFYFNLKEI